MPKPVITAPANRRVHTVSTALSVSVYAPDDASVDFKVNGSTIGAMTNAGGGVWTYSWTPVAVASSNLLTATGNVSGTSAEIVVTVDAANTVNQTMTGWTQSNTATTAPAGFTHPDGSGAIYLVKSSASGAARRLFYTSPSGAGTTPSHGFEIWAAAKPSSVTNVISYNDGAGIGKIDLVTEEISASNMYTSIVERKTVDGLSWKRVQFQRLDNAATAATSCYMDLQRNIKEALSGDSITLSAGEHTDSGVYLASPRRVDDVKLPFTTDMRLAGYLDPALSVSPYGSYDVWYMKHPKLDTETNMAGGIGGILLHVKKPSGYNTSQTWPVLWMLPALSDATEAGASNLRPVDIEAAGNYANTYQCIVVIPFERAPEYFWWGKLNTGNNDLDGYLMDAIWPWLARTYNASTSRNDHLMIGYSKSGHGALSFLLRRPDRIGFIAADDAPWTKVWPSNFNDAGFGTEANFNTYDPAQILPANLASVDDKERIYLSAGYTFESDYDDFLPILDSNSVEYTAAKTVRAKHAWLSSWADPAVAAIFAMRAQSITSPHRGFFMVN